jgi:outer membrane protein OmpA-like peptidoglycan-associated protein
MKKILTLFFLTTSLILFAQKSGEYTVKNLTVNTEYSDFGTTFYKNKQVVFSSPKKKTFWSTIVKDEWKPNGQRFLNLYTSDVDIDGELINKTALNQEVNSKYHEANVTFDKDFTTVYFTRDNYYSKKLEKDETGMTNLALFRADVAENGEWVNIQPVPFNNPDYSVGHPTLSPDGKTLYFVSDMPGGKGQTDIYQVAVMGDNTYGSPVNMSQVNTTDREMFPYVSKDNVMYFSSDRAGGQGELDIYAYNFSTDPIHLSHPLNSSSDDFAFIMDADSRSGYFSSNRTGGVGDDDIYYFTEDKPVEFDCKQYIVAKVVNGETNEPIENAQLAVFKNGKMLEGVQLTSEGVFKAEAKCKDEFAFKASASEFKPVENELTLSERNEYTNNLTLALNPIPKPKPVVVESPRIYLGPVRFDFNRHNIRKSMDADEELDRIIAIMNQYPDMVVSIESFTDSRGSDAYNKSLSQRRAERTRDYMVKKGIATNRIQGVIGRGEEMPINHCVDGVKCDEDSHQMNRRTEFVIVNPESYQNP